MQDQLTLLTMIGEVARLAEPEHPSTISQARFDRVAAEDGEYAGLPPARSLSRMFLQSWADLVELSLRESGAREQTLAMRQRVQDAQWATTDTAAGALRLICRRLGGEARLTPAVYRRERQRMLDAAGRAAGELADTLPSDNRIVSLFGDWPAALTGAGIPTPDAPTPPTRHAPSIVEILDRCYAHHLSQPTLGELELFAQSNRIPFPGRRGQTYDFYVDQWKQQRRQAGLAVPEGPPRKRDRPDYSVNVGAALPDERRGIRRWTAEMMTPWVDRFLDELPTGTRPTQRAWNDWAHGIDGAPGANRLSLLGGQREAINAGLLRRRAARRA